MSLLRSHAVPGGPQPTRHDQRQLTGIVRKSIHVPVRAKQIKVYKLEGQINSGPIANSNMDWGKVVSALSPRNPEEEKNRITKIESQKKGQTN